MSSLLEMPVGALAHASCGCVLQKTRHKGDAADYRVVSKCPLTAVKWSDLSGDCGCICEPREIASGSVHYMHSWNGYSSWAPKLTYDPLASALELEL